MRIAAGAVIAVMIVAGGVSAPAARAAVTTAPAVREVVARQAAPAGVRSRWAELANAATGADLWSRSSARERPMGSVTKVMTAYVVLTTPGLRLNRVITVPRGIVAYDDKYDASTAGLRPGERYTTLQLLYALMLPSGCDAAYTLADAYGPGLTGFIAKMNAAARRLGLTRTRFSDFSGLPDPGEYTTYSTAHDLIALGRAAMRNRTFASVVATREYRLPGGSAHRARIWKNLNPLLGRFPGATGIKTGYTSAAGQCLLFEAVRGSRTLIGVVLDSSGVNSPGLAAAASDATAMLGWGFSGLSVGFHGIEHGGGRGWRPRPRRPVPELRPVRVRPGGLQRPGSVLPVQRRSRSRRSCRRPASRCSARWSAGTSSSSPPRSSWSPPGCGPSASGPGPDSPPGPLVTRSSQPRRACRVPRTRALASGTARQFGAPVPGRWAGGAVRITWMT